MRTTPQNQIDQFTEAGWWSDQTILGLFNQAVLAHPHNLCLEDQPNRQAWTDGKTMSLDWQTLDRAVNQLTRQLFDYGLRQGDFVVVQLPNIVELPIAYLALIKLGIIISPVPAQYGRFELSQVCDKLQPSALITTSKLKNQRLCEDSSEAFVTRNINVLCFGEDIPNNAQPLSIYSESTSPNHNKESDTYCANLTLEANDIVTICWTSGTTGQPKGVPRSHNHWRIAGMGSLDAAQMQQQDILLNPFPMVNMAGLGGFFLPWLIRQNHLILHHPFDISVYLNQIQTHKVSYTIAPPAILNMLLKQPELLSTFDLSSLRAIGSGSAPLSEWMVRAFQEKHQIEIINIFGSNEGICLTSNARDLPDPGDRARYFPRFGVEGLNWASFINPMIKTRLVDLESGEVVSDPGAEGELEFWGASIFDGYWQSPEDNQQVFSADGYFRTGDVFRVPNDPDKSRFYEFIGRSKDIIVRGGVKISPDELDALLAAHPDIEAVVVVGYDDEIMGEKVGVVVVAKPDVESISLDTITAYLTNQGVAKFKFPEQLRIVDSLPMNAVGKVLRRELKPLFQV